MNGYFGSLLHQTGIALEKPPETQAPLSLEAPVQAEESSTPQPLEIEEHIEAARPSVPGEITGQEPATRDSQPMSATSVAEPIKPAASGDAPRTMRETGPVSPAPLPSKPEPEQDWAPAPKAPATPATAPTVAAARSEESSRSSEAVEMASSPRSVEKIAAVERDATESPSLTGVPAQSPQSSPPAPAPPPTRTIRQVVREQVWKTAFTQVRDWVAAQPVQTTREQRDRIAGKAADAIQKETLHVVRARAVADSSGRNGGSPSLPDRDAVADLHLTIGKIEISLEQPRQEDRRSGQAADRVAPKAVPDRPSSRLRRQYLVP